MDGVVQCFRQIKSIEFDPFDFNGRNAGLVFTSQGEQI